MAARELPDRPALRIVDADRQEPLEPLATVVEHAERRVPRAVASRATSRTWTKPPPYVADVQIEPATISGPARTTHDLRAVADVRVIVRLDLVDEIEAVYQR